MSVASSESFIEQVETKLYPKIEESLEAAVYFASELNISNGDPALRTGEGGFGERYMFGRLLSIHTADIWLGTATDDDLSRMIEETKRLLTGSLRPPGENGYFSTQVQKGRILDLDAGVWVRSYQNSTDAIKIVHKTEYYGKIRHAYLVEYNGYLTLWRK